MFAIWETMGRCAAVARRELLYVVPFGLSAWLAGTVLIDRRDSGKANRTLTEVARVLNKDKTKLWLFPEGTRNRKGDGLLPFKKGAFRVAIQCQVPIIPVVFSPYYFIDSKKKYFGGGRVIITALEPIQTVGLSLDDLNSLMSQIYAKMECQYQESKKEIFASIEAASIME